MRLHNYLFETKEHTLVDVVRDCKPFFSQNPGFLYRGYQDIGDIALLNQRKDRRPKDMPILYHDALDKAFLKKFGWKCRSEGIFVTSRAFNAFGYGKIYMVFPIGGFQFVWSPVIMDLYGYYIKTVDPFHKNIMEKINQWAFETVDLYQATDLKMAREVGHEIMIDVDKYYLVSTDLSDDLLNVKIG